MTPKKKIKDYLNKSVRKLKHRKGFGVHSPFAYSIITEVIEEKLPYYAYRRMLRTFDKNAPFPHKVACLLLRLANRFHCRRALEVSCDGGYTALPLILTDSSLHVDSIVTPNSATSQQTLDRLSWLVQRVGQQMSFVTPAELISAGDSCPKYDMILVRDTEALEQITALFPGVESPVDAILSLCKEDTLILSRGIQPHRLMEHFWDELCDRDEVTITMDLYDYGIAILKPRFFKQHYIVSF